MSLRRAAVSGVVWTGMAAASALVLRLVTLAVIARYLTKAELGLVSMLLALIVMMQAFADFGMTSLIVQRRSLAREQLSSLFWLAQLAGILTFGLVVVAEPMIVELYREPRLAGLVTWLAVRFVLTPIGIPFQAILQRDLQFRRTFVIQVGGAIVGTAVTIAGAIRGQGVYALIAGELVTTATQSLLALLLGWSTWHPRPHLRIAEVRETLRFGGYQVGERALNLIAMNVDYVLIGRVLGAEVLAGYALAFELVSQPARLNFILTRVAFPVLARKQDEPDAFRRGVAEVFRVVALVQLPLLGGIAVLAPLLVPVLLGPGWERTVSLVQVLSLFGALRVLGNPAGPAILAKGRPEIGFRFNLFVVLTTVPVLMLVVDHGVEAVGWAWVVLSGVYLVVWLVLLNRIALTSWRLWATTFARPLLITAVSIGFLWIGRAASLLADATPTVQLSIAVVVAGVPIALACWFIERLLIVTTLRALRREAAP